MNMITSIQALLGISVVLNAWNGVQNKLFLTSNRLIQAFVAFGIDAPLNSVSVKQLFVYDYLAFVEALTHGIEFVYQGRVYRLQTVKGFTQITVWNKFNELELNKRLSQRTVASIDRSYLNKDIADLLNGLIKRGL